MENRFGCKLKSSISIALSFSLLAQPFLAPLAQAQSTQSIFYDTNGNMTQDENGNTYEYDAENRLISFVKGDGKLKTEYTYYANGLRKSKQITLSNGSVSDPIVFYYDHAKNANVVNEVQGSGSSQVTSSYLMVDDTRYARYLSNDTSKPKYYVKNHKDTTMTVGANGADPISHAYTPYGEERDSKGTGVTTTDFSIASNPFLYSSEYTDQESGLQYLRARYYKADHMRFISRDTNSVPRNKYAYANGNPIMEDDPSGMMANWVRHFLAGAAGFIAGGAIEALTGGAGTLLAAAVGNAAGTVVEKGILGEKMTATDLAIGAGAGAAGGILAIAGKAVAERLAERLATRSASKVYYSTRATANTEYTSKFSYTKDRFGLLPENTTGKYVPKGKYKKSQDANPFTKAQEAELEANGLGASEKVNRQNLEKIGKTDVKTSLQEKNPNKRISETEIQSEYNKIFLPQPKGPLSPRNYYQRTKGTGKELGEII